jgi:hypothetical protein
LYFVVSRTFSLSIGLFGGIYYICGGGGGLLGRMGFVWTVPGLECVGRLVPTLDVCGEVGKPVYVGAPCSPGKEAVIRFELGRGGGGGRAGFRIFVAVFM